MRAASVIPARTSRALLNSPASTVVLRRMRFMPLLCHVLGKLHAGFWAHQLGDAAAITTYVDESERNGRSWASVSRGRSCWTQWPAPSIR